MHKNVSSCFMMNSFCISINRYVLATAEQSLLINEISMIKQWNVRDKSLQATYYNILNIMVCLLVRDNILIPYQALAYLFSRIIIINNDVFTFTVYVFVAYSKYSQSNINLCTITITLALLHNKSPSKMYHLCLRYRMVMRGSLTT